MKKIAAVIMIATLLTKVAGFARDIALSYFFGISYISDAYIISLSIPMTIFAFIGTGIATSYIPMYSSLEKESGIRRADAFTSNVINFIMIICTVITILGIAFAVPIVKLFASGFKGETLALASNFTRITIFGTYFYSLVYIFSGYLQLKNNFLAPAVMGIPSNIFLIVSIALGAKFTLTSLSVGSVIAIAIQVVFLLPFIYKNGYKYSFVLDRKDKDLKKMIYLAMPVIMGISVNQVNALVDRTIASNIAEGSIAALNFATRLDGFIQAVFVASIATAIYPTISKMAAEGNIKGLKKSFAEAIIGVSLLVVPAMIGSMIFSEPIVRLLFGRGAFGESAINMTSQALFYYSIGMVGAGIWAVLSRVCYSLQDTKTPTICATIAVGMNIILNIILSKFMGIGGLALATSIAAIFSSIALSISLRKKIGPFGIRNLVISFAKIFTASIIMGVLARLNYGLLLSRIGSNMSLVLSIGLGAVVYLGILYFIKIEEVDLFIAVLKSKGKKMYS